MKRLQTDQARLKVALRYANAVTCLQGCLGRVDVAAVDIREFQQVPKHKRKNVSQATRIVAEAIVAAEALGMNLPTHEQCANPVVGNKILRRLHKTEVDVPEGEYELMTREDYRGFTIVVNKLLTASRFCYQPEILKGSDLVHSIFVRSKSPEVSVEHFAKRAIDKFIADGCWPVKIGIALPGAASV